MKVPRFMHSWKFYAIIVVLVWILIGIIIYFSFFHKNDIITNENNNNVTTCLSLGCSQETLFVGSVNSDKYYTCNCRYAKTIKKENIACFESAQVAEIKGYTKIEC